MEAIKGERRKKGALGGEVGDSNEQEAAEGENNRGEEGRRKGWMVGETISYCR